MKSVTRLLIDATSKAVFADLFKPLDFKRKAPNLRRDIDGLVQTVNFQASQWGSAESGSFTINIGVSDPGLIALWMGTNVSPTVLHFPVGVRIGHLMPEGCDQWWDVGPDTDAAATQAAVSNALQDRALPLFDRFSTRRALYEAMIEGLPRQLGRFGSPKLLKAFGQHRLGLRDEASQTLRQLREESTIESFRTRLAEIATRLAAESEIPIPAKSP